MAVSLGNIQYVFRSKVINVTTEIDPPEAASYQSGSQGPHNGIRIAPKDSSGNTINDLPLNLGIIYDPSKWSLNRVLISRQGCINDPATTNGTDISLIRDSGGATPCNTPNMIPCDIPDGGNVNVRWELGILNNKIFVVIGTVENNNSCRVNVCAIGSCPGSSVIVATPTLYIDEGVNGEGLDNSVECEVNGLIYRGEGTTVGWDNLNTNFEFLSVSHNGTMPGYGSKPGLTFSGTNNWNIIPEDYIEEPGVDGEIKILLGRIQRYVKVTTNSGSPACGTISFTVTGKNNNGNSIGSVTSGTTFQVDSGTCIDVNVSPAFCCELNPTNGVTVNGSPSGFTYANNKITNLCILNGTSVSPVDIIFNYRIKTFNVTVVHNANTCGAGGENNSHSSSTHPGTGNYIVNCNASITITTCASNCCDYDNYTIIGGHNPDSGNNNNGYSTSNDNHTHSQINNSVGGTTVTINNITADLTLTFNYSARKFDVSVTTSVGGSYNITSGSLTGLTCGQSVNIQCLPDPCYVLDYSNVTGAFASGNVNNSSTTSGSGSCQVLNNGNNGNHCNYSVVVNNHISRVAHPCRPPCV